MLWVVLGLGALVVFLARRAPDTTPGQTLGPDTSLPALGIVTSISPAMSAGAPGIAYQNEVRLNTNYQMAPDKIRSESTPRAFWKGRAPAMGGVGNYPTDADSNTFSGSQLAEMTPSAAGATTQKL